MRKTYVVKKDPSSNLKRTRSVSMAFEGGTPMQKLARISDFGTMSDLGLVGHNYATATR